MHRTLIMAAAILLLACTSGSKPGSDGSAVALADAALTDVAAVAPDEETPGPSADAPATDPGAGVADPGPDPSIADLPPADTAAEDVAAEDVAAAEVIAPSAADVTARLLYINQRVFREDDAFAQGGTASLSLHASETPPKDTRQSWVNTDGEICSFESYTEWPWEFPSGVTWPEGPFLDAGDITLRADGAPGPVVYAWYDTFYMRDEPGPVEQGYFTHSSFFPPEYLPHGAGATVTAAGGAGVGSFEVGEVRLAEDYMVSSPNLAGGGDVIDTGEALDIEWAPSAPGGTMTVLVKDATAYLKCVLEDDGRATVPAEAMAALLAGPFVRFTVQTWREKRTVERVVTGDGAVVDVEVVSRHAQIGRFEAR